MDLRKLRLFAEVARRASFSEAARRLHMAQPAVSIAVRKLEETLGLRLLNRRGNRVVPTSEGAALLRHAERILAEVERAQVEMEELRGLRKGEVRIGVPSMLGSYYFPEILMAFKEAYPELALSVVEAGARDIQRMITAGELDMGVVVSDEVAEGLEGAVFLREEMVVCVPPDHPFAVRGAVSSAAFLAEPLVLFKEGYFHREFVERLSQAAGIAPVIAFETNLIPLIRAIVRKGYGVTNFLRLVVAGADGLVARPFEEPVWLDLSIAWKRGGYLSHADRRFVQFLLDHARVPHPAGTG